MIDKIKDFYDFHKNGIDTVLGFIIFLTYFPVIAIIKEYNNTLLCIILSVYIIFITLKFAIELFKVIDKQLEEHYTKQRKLRELE
ncbi:MULTISPECIES: hypothetical protein [unclassified Dehalobacter]|jgi:hypothetical protein|uniref:hypothetical protein n=1 Tax=unclassified Dehalobacter TaxID=2635733 RepID=UPI00059E0731|nr:MULTISPECIES: hypothetical protein [unclassified Dehalobacter]